MLCQGNKLKQSKNAIFIIHEQFSCMNSHTYWDVNCDLCSHCDLQGCLPSSYFLPNKIFFVFVFFCKKKCNYFLKINSFYAMQLIFCEKNYNYT